MMNILCFGDSNTYGYDPRSYFGGRYPAEERWVDILADKLGGRAVNAGQNGREIPSRELEIRRFHSLLADQKPVDLLLIMLGTNDLLQGNSVETVVGRMERFLKGIHLERSKICLIVPPPMTLGAWVSVQTLADASRELGAAYERLAGTLGISCVDPGTLSLAFDGVHLTPAGHAVLAERLYRHLMDGWQI